MTTVLITGNTYPVKEQIKALGGRWNPEQKGWVVPEAKAHEAMALVANAASQPRTESIERKPFRHYKCTDCGARADRYRPIYRNGQCRDCWLSDKEEREMGY